MRSECHWDSMASSSRTAHFHCRRPSKRESGRGLATLAFQTCSPPGSPCNSSSLFASPTAPVIDDATLQACILAPAGTARGSPHLATPLPLEHSAETGAKSMGTGDACDR